MTLSAKMMNKKKSKATSVPGPVCEGQRLKHDSCLYILHDFVCECVCVCVCVWVSVCVSVSVSVCVCVCFGVCVGWSLSLDPLLLLAVCSAVWEPFSRPVLTSHLPSPGKCLCTRFMHTFYVYIYTHSLHQSILTMETFSIWCLCL